MCQLNGESFFLNILPGEGTKLASLNPISEKLKRRHCRRRVCTRFRVAHVYLIRPVLKSLYTYSRRPSRTRVPTSNAAIFEPEGDVIYIYIYLFLFYPIEQQQSPVLMILYNYHLRKNIFPFVARIAVCLVGTFVSYAHLLVSGGDNAAPCSWIHLKNEHFMSLRN